MAEAAAAAGRFASAWIPARPASSSPPSISFPGPNDIAEGPGRLIYNSSGRILNGERYTTEVEIQRDENTPVATARVQVLRVSSITCLERARDCRPESNPRGVAFMGVGFDRTGAQGTEPGAPRNPFVSLVSLASGAPLSSVRPGYIVTREGVHLGMSAERTRGFAFIKLASNPASRPGVPNGAPRRWRSRSTA